MLSQIPIRMYRLSILFIIILSAVALVGQEASIMLDSIIYITPEDEVLLRDKEAKYLAKLGSDISFELKVAKAFSVELELFPNIISFTHDLEFSLGARYYYQMASRIKAGKQANNFSGNYVSGMIGKGISFYPQRYGNRTAYILGIGTQQRYLQNEYFDFGLMIAYQSNNTTRGTQSLFTIFTESNYGFVFGKKHEINEANLCPVVKCYQDRKSAIKFNRNNLIYLSYAEFFDNSLVFWLRPNVGYEFKLGDSAFSVNQELSTALIFATSGMRGITSLGLVNFDLTYSLAGRYYYRMKKKILAGEQGNNLSGSYMYAKFKNQYLWDKGQISTGSNGSVLLGIGRQTRITGSLFLDAQLGIGPQIYGDVISLIPGNVISPIRDFNIISGVDIELRFAIGYMF